MTATEGTLEGDRLHRSSAGEGGGPADTARIAAVLDAPLTHPGLPTRILSFAARHGIERFRELVAWAPERLAQERNVGRGTLRQTRHVIEAAAGCTWEQLLAAMNPAPADESDDPAAAPPAVAPPGAAPAQRGWDGLASLLDDSRAATPLGAVALPARMRSFAAREGIATLGELARIPSARLLDAPNLGRATVADADAAIRALLASDHGTAAQSIDAYRDLPELLRHKLAPLSAIDRMVVTQRSGLLGAPQTLADLGGMLGVSRERARQIEARALAGLSRDRQWIDALEARLRARLPTGAIPLAVLAEDPFWPGDDERRGVLDYVLDRLLDGRLHLVDVDGQALVSEIPDDAIDEVWRTIVARARGLPFPVGALEVDVLVDRCAAALGAALASTLRQRLDGQLQRAQGGGSLRYTGFGATRVAEVLAFLNASPGPVPVAELEARFGRVRLPDEAIYVDRGVVALPRHVPDFERWRARLGPLCASILRREGADRQWSTVELLDLLAEEAQLPDWFNYWHLAALLRASEEVVYLGRLRVSLRGAPTGEERLHADELLAVVLREAGAPLAEATAVERARVRARMPEQTLRNTLRRPPFVEIEDGRFGLVERDLRGGAEAWAEAAEALAEQLEARGVGLSLPEAVAIVREVSDDHAAWTLEAVRSVSRGAAGLRTALNGAVGLARWDDVRVPTRRSILLACLEEGRGRAPISTVQDRIAAVHGARPARRHLASLAYAAGVSLHGDELVEHVSPAAPPPAVPGQFPGVRALPGFPARGAIVFEELLAEPVGDLEELRRAAFDYVRVFEEAAADSPFLDPDEARAVAARSSALIDALGPSPTPAHRQLVWAAVRYFTKYDDADHDLAVGGLDDDLAVVNAITAYLAATS